MIFIFLFWLWFFTNLFLPPTSDDTILILSLVCTFGTVDFIWITKRLIS